MKIEYDERGICRHCGLPGSGFISEGVCECADRPLPKFHRLSRFQRKEKSYELIKPNSLHTL